MSKFRVYVVDDKFNEDIIEEDPQGRMERTIWLTETFLKDLLK